MFVYLQNPELTRLEQVLVKDYPRMRLKWMDERYGIALPERPRLRKDAYWVCIAIISAVLLIHYGFKLKFSVFWGALVVFAYLYYRGWAMMQNGRDFFRKNRNPYSKECLDWLRSFDQIDINPKSLKKIGRDLKRNVSYLDGEKTKAVSHTLSASIIGFLSTFGLTATSILKTTQELDSLPSTIIDIVGIGCTLILVWWLYRKYYSFKIEYEEEVQYALRMDIRTIIQEYDYLTGEKPSDHAKKDKDSGKEEDHHRDDERDKKNSDASDLSKEEKDIREDEDIDHIIKDDAGRLTDH